MKSYEPHPDDTRFERLADGELSPAEYQTLLASLDDEPGGWRRCALSFLEAQALTRELGSLRRERVELPPPVTQAAPLKARRIGYPLMALAMAASFLLAFGLGMAIRQNGAPSGSTTTTPQVAEIGQQNSGRQSETPLAAPGDQSPRSVTLVVDGSGNSPQQSIEVPLYNYDQVGDDYLSGDQSAVSPAMQEILKRHGHEIRRHRQLVPFAMEDGRQAVFPMEDVEIVPIRMPPF